jgi:hypothetical protein
MGCSSPSDPDPTETEELCGSTEPVLLLELSANEHPSRNPLQAIRRVDDRLVYFIETHAEEAPYPPEESSDVLGQTIYSTGLCGEDRATMGEADLLYDPRHDFGDVVLGCDWATGDVVVLDPKGGESRVVLAEVGCAALPVADGIVGVRRYEPGIETGELVYVPSLIDPEAQEQVLRQGVLAPFTETTFFFADIRRMRATGNEVLTLWPSGEVEAINVVSGESRVELDDVAGFELSFDGGFIMWQQGPPVLAGGYWETREMFLRDRAEDENSSLGPGRFGIGSGGVQTGMVRSTADFQNEDTLVVLLPSGKQFSFSPDMFVNGRHPESGFILWSPSAADGSPGALHVFDPDSEESMPVFDRYGGWTYEGDQFLMLEKTDEDQYTLWERYLSDPDPVVVAEDTFQPFFVADDKLATVRDLEGTRHGSLYAIDRETGLRGVLDDAVNAYSARLNWLGALGDAFAYAVSDGDRSGIYGLKLRQD